MALDVDQVRQRATTAFAGFTSGQKTVLAIAVVAAVIGAYGFTKWAATPSYTTLYTNLPAADAAAVTEELTAKGVPYQLTDGGGTVKVPQESVYQLRLDMSAEGLPAEGAPGYALLDKQGITTSEFRQRVDYQRALEGELSKTIGSIDGVQGATVNLVIPSEDLFTRDAKKATASVQVHTRPGETLAGGQVQAIVHLVSSSIEGMDPADVTVTDNAGRLLKAAGDDGMVAGANDVRTAQTQSFQTQLAGSLEAMLAPLVGPDGAVVTVNAELDFDQRATVTERFDNEDNPVLSESSTVEDYTGPGNGVVGVLGLDGTPAAEGQGTEYAKEEAARSFAVGKVTEEVKGAPGDVERLNVSVLLDGAAGNVNAQAVEQMIATAAGIDAERGDAIEIAILPFDQAANEAAEAELAERRALETRQTMISLARTIGVVLIALIALFLAYRSARKSTLTKYPVAVPIDPPPGPSPESVNDAADAINALVEAIPVSAADKERLAIEADIGNMIDRQPEEVAVMLRGWLADRRS